MVGLCEEKDNDDGGATAGQTDRASPPATDEASTLQRVTGSRHVPTTTMN